MPDYDDFDPEPGATPADNWELLTQLLVGNYSVEVLPRGDSVKLRVWYDAHCELPPQPPAVS